jgi:2-C-methyl-D-erythritol 4-phosphate cytidylyltransferase
MEIDMTEKISAIVLAAGTGSRMNSKTKKQYMNLNGKPVLWYSLFQFEKSNVDEIILVTSEEDIEFCKKEIVDKYHLTKIKHIISGGKERYNSVYNGLSKVTGKIVLIHDGARPLVNREIIENCIRETKKSGACVAGVPVKDTIKVVGEDRIIERTPYRNSLWITQTPQSFEKELIKTAYHKMMSEENISVTDDAMVVEQFTDNKVRFVQGSYTNIKITTPEDIELAELLLSRTQNIV